ncbi:MAG: glycoside hydrolase family 1 protein [Roseburia sp.]|nr:glycoside hydrolase family 1 protein [Roseburia sp.]
MNFPFPKDFLFGAACSACQIESACNEGGKGEDVGEHYFKLYPEKYCGGDPNNSADFYWHYREDIKKLKEMGLKILRFTISWSRIYPNGPKEVCQAGIDYYSDLIDAIKEAGMVAFFDLFHCDLPYWVIEKGGIIDPEFSDWFCAYAKTCFEAFGDRVDYWATVNEPSINCMGAYAYGINAPFMKDMEKGLLATHNMILTHYRVVRMYKSMGFHGKISAVLHVQPTYSLSLDPKDIAAADRDMEFYSGVWLDAMFLGRYPEVLLKYPWYKDKLPKNYEKELRDNFIPSDFIGFNYYNPAFARYVDNGELDYEIFANQELSQDGYGFVQYPQGLFDLLMYLKNKYPGVELMITENGVGKKKWGNLEEEREDDYRVTYLREHLREISRAYQAGAPVTAYCHWSFMDTNELYAGGYNYMFGLMQVNFETKERIPRKSFHYYKKVIENGMVD